MTREEAINQWVKPAIKNTWNEKKCREIIEALEQGPYEKFESVKDHICKLAGDYKCWDNRLTDDEALELCRILEREPCTDCISREAVKELFQEACEMKMYDFLGIDDLPSVNPQPKTGHWIMIDKELQRYKCSECGEVIRLYKKSEIPKFEKDETLSNYPFSHCGCRMVESQENEK